MIPPGSCVDLNKWHRTIQKGAGTRALWFLIVTSFALSPAPSRSQPNNAQGQPPTNWWWCDASRAYYPAVGTCATPWRAVDAQGQPVGRSSPPGIPTMEPNPAPSAKPSAAPTQSEAPAAGGAPATANYVWRPNWRRVEADNGAVIAINMNSIQHNSSGNADASVCVVENDACSPLNMKHWFFDCHGHHFQESLNAGGFSPMVYAPPRSLAGGIVAIACAGAKDMRFMDDSDHPDLSGTTSAEYCRGFPPDACARIKAMVDGRAPLPPCKAGFGVVGSGYTPEQIRACAVRHILHDAQSPTLVASSARPAPSVKPGETVIGQWSGKGNGKSNQFHIERGPWEFRVTTADFISGGVYKATDRTGVTTFAFQEPGERTRLTASGDFYFVVQSASNWTVTVVSLSHQ